MSILLLLRTKSSLGKNRFSQWTPTKGQKPAELLDLEISQLLLCISTVYDEIFIHKLSISSCEGQINSSLPTT